MASSTKESWGGLFLYLEGVAQWENIISVE